MLVLLACILIMVACQPNVSIQTAQYAVNGQKLYTVHCQNCHGASGEGLGKLYPPLTDSTFLIENRYRLACIIKKGMHEPIVVAGQTYKGVMPAFPQLTDTDIAYILTYVTTTFGNSTQTFHQDEVAKTRQDCK